MATTKEKYRLRKKDERLKDVVLICEALNGVYHSYDDDAETISECCDIPMTYRHVSFPSYKVSDVLMSLIKNGKRVALVEYFMPPTLYDLCDYINESKGVPQDLEEVIKKWKFESCLNDYENPKDIARAKDCDSLYAVFTDKGKAVVINKVKY